MRIALVGNPNSGKSTLFNYLTGLHQRVGNYPGVTVEESYGSYSLDSGDKIELIDLPGTYNIYPQTEDERVVGQVLSNPEHTRYPDGVFYVMDINALDKQLLLLTQIVDLGLPTQVLLTMSDLRIQEEVEYISNFISESIGVHVHSISIHNKTGLEKIDDAILTFKNLKPSKSFYLGEGLNSTSEYRNKIKNTLNEVGAKSFSDLQVKEVMGRYDRLERMLAEMNKMSPTQQQFASNKIDRWLTHPIVGPIVFFMILLLTFQAIYSWTGVPMDFIENAFSRLAAWVPYALGSGPVADFIADGVLAGIGGVVIFVPQIALLFLIITALEESGYMARAVYLFDPLMQRFGLSGRSLVALVSSGACAIPAIMSARTIRNPKERLRTILVSPLISCSARLPVYTVLIGLMVPAGTLYGFNTQGLAFMGVYLLSIISTLIVAGIFTLWQGRGEQSTLMLELPIYRRPSVKSVLVTVWMKVKIFILEAGKIILMISMVLWFLASYGPGDHEQRALEAVQQETLGQSIAPEALEDRVAGRTLEYSYIGIMGKWIEPVIKPLGYDWKIGIALITSFAAREVFVGTMATIYSIGSTDDELSIKERMAAEVNPRTGLPVYTLATSLSLLWFYIYAMQCMSTLAIAKRETGGWKWPMFMLVYMTLIAVVGSFTIYQFLS